MQNLLLPHSGGFPLFFFFFSVPVSLIPSVRLLREERQRQLSFPTWLLRREGETGESSRVQSSRVVNPAFGLLLPALSLWAEKAER